FHAGPRPGGAAPGPVDQVEVDLVDPESLEATLGHRRRVLACRVELGGDEDILARHAALAKRPADALLVPVRLGRVDMPVAELERPPHGVHAFGSVRHLPDAQAEQRELAAVSKRERGLVRGHGSQATENPHTAAGRPGLTSERATGYL